MSKLSKVILEMQRLIEEKVCGLEDGATDVEQGEISGADHPSSGMTLGTTLGITLLEVMKKVLLPLPLPVLLPLLQQLPRFLVRV